MAERGIRWIRLALYLVGALGLALLAFFTGIGKGKLGGRKDAGPRDAGGKTDTVAMRTPDTRAAEATTAPKTPTHAPAAKRRTKLSPQVRQPEDPPSWDYWDMNLE